MKQLSDLLQKKGSSLGWEVIPGYGPDKEGFIFEKENKSGVELSMQLQYDHNITIDVFESIFTSECENYISKAAQEWIADVRISEGLTITNAFTNKIIELNNLLTELKDFVYCAINSSRSREALKSEEGLEFDVPVTYESWGLVKVKANSKSDLLRKLNNPDFIAKMPLPVNPEYLDESYRIDFDSDVLMVSTLKDITNYIGKHTLVDSDTFIETLSLNAVGKVDVTIRFTDLQDEFQSTVLMIPKDEIFVKGTWNPTEIFSQLWINYCKDNNFDCESVKGVFFD
ncbi:hypothetical protein M2146_001079 [Lachnospiraceae bacterium PF1-22]